MASNVASPLMSSVASLWLVNGIFGQLLERRDTSDRTPHRARETAASSFPTPRADVIDLRIAGPPCLDVSLELSPAEHQYAGSVTYGNEIRHSAQAIAPCEVRAVITAWTAAATPAHVRQETATTPISSRMTTSIMRWPGRWMLDASMSRSSVPHCKSAGRFRRPILSCHQYLPFQTVPIGTKIDRMRTSPICHANSQHPASEPTSRT